MNENILNSFLLSVAGNQKILASHVSLFSAILCCKTSNEDAFNINRRKLMELSKIRSTATYHKCINDLIILGVIKYMPSFHPRLGSKINLSFE